MSWTDRRQDAERYGAAWRKARAAALARARYRCEVRLDGCTGKATQVDHVLGAGNDPTHQHLRAICDQCHRHITAKQGRAAQAAAPPADPQPRPATTW